MHRANRQVLGPSWQTPQKGKFAQMVKKGLGPDEGLPVHLLASCSPAVTGGTTWEQLPV